MHASAHKDGAFFLAKNEKKGVENLQGITKLTDSLRERFSPFAKDCLSVSDPKRVGDAVFFIECSCQNEKQIRQSI